MQQFNHIFITFLTKETLDLFTILASIATSFAAFLTYKTLIEVKAQREAMYRPDLIIEQNRFSIFIRDSKQGEKTIEYTYEKKAEKSVQKRLKKQDFYFNIYNIGLATAKDIKLKFIIDIKENIKIVEKFNNQIPKNKNVTITQNRNLLEFSGEENSIFGKSIHHIQNQSKDQVNHILPITISNEPTKIYFPSFLLDFYKLYVVNQWNINTSQINEFPDFPSIKIQIKYLDIGNKAHVKEYEVSLIYSGGTENDIYNFIEAKQINFN